MEGEKWVNVVEYNLPAIYEISSLGRIRSKERHSLFKNRWGDVSSRLIPLKILKTRIFRGYETISLRDKKGVSHTFFIHRLVAKAFIPNYENKLYVDHINTIKNDNRVENLRWCTCSENQLNPLTRIHLSNAMIGNTRSKNRVMTEEHKRKISEAITGRKLSKDTIDKIKKSLTGRKLTEAEKEKRSKSVAQYSKDGTLIKVWPSAASAERNLGIRWANIMKCANPKSKNKTAGNYIWKFV